MYCMCSNYKVDLLILSTLIYSFTWLFQYCYYSIYSINSTKLRVQFYIIHPFLPPVSFPFPHPVPCYCLLLHVVAQSLKPVKRLATCKRAQQLLTMLGQQCWEFWELLRPLVRSFIRLRQGVPNR